MTNPFQEELTKLGNQIVRVQKRQLAYDYLLRLNVSARYAFEICKKDDWSCIYDHSGFTDEEKSTLRRIVS